MTLKRTDGSNAKSKMKRKVYERELHKLQVELCHLQDWVKQTGARIIILFEGRDAAGKGGTIKAITERVSPRAFRVVALPAPSDREKTQMFGQRYIDAHGTTVGTIQISANAISRFITFSVPTSSLGGTPASGWGFTVVLTGQDGFSPDQARGFTATPGAFTFGVCATVSTDSHCTVDPSTVPKAMDVITPPGVSQSTELDYTLGPVVIQGVTIP